MKFVENLRILQGKIHWIRSEMRGENPKFPGEFSWIRLKIRIELKMGEKKKKKRHLKGKICKIWRKCRNFTRENSLNQIWNEKKKCRISMRIQLNSIEDSNLSENGRKEQEKTTLERENSAILQGKIHWIRSKMRKENAEFAGESNWIRLKIRVEVKIAEKKKKKSISKWKFAEFGENFTILQRKIH